MLASYLKLIVKLTERNHRRFPCGRNGVQSLFSIVTAAGFVNFRCRQQEGVSSRAVPVEFNTVGLEEAFVDYSIVKMRISE